MGLAVIFIREVRTMNIFLAWLKAEVSMVEACIFIDMWVRMEIKVLANGACICGRSTCSDLWFFYGPTGVFGIAAKYAEGLVFSLKNSGKMPKAFSRIN